MPLLALQSPPPAARQSALSSVLNTLTSLPSARVKNVRIEVQPPSPRAPASPAGGLAAPATPGFVKLRSEAEGDATPHVQLVVETAVPLFGWRLLLALTLTLALTLALTLTLTLTSSAGGCWRGPRCPATRGGPSPACRATPSHR